MPGDGLGTFAKHLADRRLLAGEAAVRVNGAASPGGERSLRALWELTELSANDCAAGVARFHGLPRVSLRDLVAAESLDARFSRRFLRDTLIFPFAGADGKARLAIADPTDEASLRAVEIVLGAAVRREVASFEDLATVLAQRLQEDDSTPPDLLEAGARADDDVGSLRRLAPRAPVVRAVNDLVEKAVELRATDIHIEPFKNGLVIRMRVDGLLRTVPTPAAALPQALVSRIKILAGLNIAERRLPQDGAARLKVGSTDLDVRVATMPTQYGETAVVRLLPRDRGLLEITRLGLSPPDQAKLSAFLALPYGMIAVTGPTGSGKTTTLATALTILNETTRKILTIEDPVEYEIRGINQSQVKPGIGLTFATAMRAFVRQDPDVIMVGEVRDAETAHIAVHAALTGHLVLTTLHTENAAAAVPRLLDLGVEDFLLRSTLRAVIAQRLVRRLCDRCKLKKKLGMADIDADPRYAALGFDVGAEVHEPVGCESCGGTGYRGRLGIFEVLELNHKVRSLIHGKTDAAM